MGWIIVNKDDGLLCWNDSHQQWELEDYDTFSPKERETMTLPPNGEWEQVDWAKED